MLLKVLFGCGFSYQNCLVAISRNIFEIPIMYCNILDVKIQKPFKTGKIFYVLRKLMSESVVELKDTDFRSKLFYLEIFCFHHVTAVPFY